MDQRHAPSGRTLALGDVGEVLVAEVVERAQHGVGRRPAQAAQRRLLHQQPKPLELGQVFQAAVAAGDPLEDFEHPHGPFPAGRTLAARLVLGEGHEELGHVDHAVVFVQDDHPAGAHDRAGLGQGVEVDGGVEPLFGDATARGPARLDGLQPLPAGHAAADLLDHFAERGPHGDLDQPGVASLAGQGKDLGPAAGLGPQLTEPVGPVSDDRRDVGERLHVVDHRGLAPQAALGGVRRTDTRLTALAFDGVDQRRLFAADERPGPQPDLQVEVEPGIQDILAQQAPLAALVDGVAYPPDGQGILRPNVEEAPARADGVSCDEHPLDDVEGVAFEHAAVHEGAGVPFVGVADQVSGGVGGRRAHGPLLPRGISAPAAAAELGAGDLVDHPIRVAAIEHLGQRLEAAIVEVLLDAFRIDHPVVTQGHARLLIEERHVPIELEELPADRLAGHDQTLDHLPVQQVLPDDLVQILLVLHPVEDLVGAHQQVRVLPELLGRARPETTGRGQPDLLGAEPGRAELLGQKLAAEIAPPPTTSGRATVEDLVPGDPLDRAVEHVLQQRLAAEHVPGEDPVHQLPVDALVFHGHLAGDQHAHDRLAATAPRAAGAMQ